MSEKPATALESFQQGLLRMLDQSSLPAAVCGSDGLIRYCNDALASLLRRPTREVQGCRWADLWSVERPARVTPGALLQTAAGQGPAVEELWLATGTPIRVRWHRLPMPAMGVGPAGPEGTPVTDVLMLGECLARLDHVEAESSYLAERLSFARRAEAVGRYAGHFAHDFNSLLGGILGFAELAEDNLRDGTDCREEILEILKLVSRGRALVEQLLDAKRRFQSRFQAVNLSAVLEAELENMPLAVLGLEIRRNLEPNLPATRIDPPLARLLLFSLFRLFARFVYRGTLLSVSTREHRGKAGPGSVAGSTWMVMELRVEGAEVPLWWRDGEDDEFWGDAERPPEMPEAELSAVAGLVRDHRGWWSLSREPAGITARVYFPAALSE